MSQHCQETLSLFSGVGSFDKYPCNNIEAFNVVPVYWVAVITSVKCKQWPQSPSPPHIISFIIRSEPGKCDVHCSHTLLYIHTTLHCPKNFLLASTFYLYIIRGHVLYLHDDDCCSPTVVCKGEKIHSCQRIELVGGEPGY